ncbi:MAG: NAD-dependent epimerase/dehydratase family protein [Thermoguttaceae bacterium]|nr:NAD-dependent epimerase/dehydratase family protein [Thermoguttaceae bacterium]
MRALVTGAGGFLGLYLTEALLRNGDTVRGVCRGCYPELDALGVQCFHADLGKADCGRDQETLFQACEGVDVIFHTAAISGIGEPWEKYYRTNTLGTRNLLEAAKKAGVKKFVLTSSPSVTFAGEPQCGIDESAPYPEKWLAHYPHSKALAEKMVLEANGENGLLTCALRPHLIWGPRDKALIPRLIARARSGRLRRVGDGANLVDMIYVENAALAHIQAAEALRDGAPVCGRAYFLSQGEPVNCWEWIDELLAIYDLPPVRKSISFKTASSVGFVCEKIWKIFGWESDPPMTRFLAAQLAHSHYFDLALAREHFGYFPKYSKSEGMEALRQEYLEKNVKK